MCCSRLKFKNLLENSSTQPTFTAKATLAKETRFFSRLQRQNGLKLTERKKRGGRAGGGGRNEKNAWMKPHLRCVFNGNLHFFSFFEDSPRGLEEGMKRKAPRIRHGNTFGGVVYIKTPPPRIKGPRFQIFISFISHSRHLKETPERIRGRSATENTTEEIKQGTTRFQGGSSR